MKILLMFFCAIAFLTSCGVKQEVNNNVLNASSVKGEVSSVESSVKEHNALENIISLIPSSLKNKEDFHACVKSNIDMCITEQAQTSPESMKCEDFLVESNRTLCNEQKKILLAKETNDISICESLVENKYACEYEVVLKKAMGNGDTTQCESLSDGYKIPCNNEVVKKKALDENDVKICEGIIPYVEGDVFEKKFCEDEVQFSIDEKKRIKDEQAAQEAFENSSEVQGDPLEEENQ